MCKGGGSVGRRRGFESSGSMEYGILGFEVRVIGSLADEVRVTCILRILVDNLSVQTSEYMARDPCSLTKIRG